MQTVTAIGKVVYAAGKVLRDNETCGCGIASGLFWTRDPMPASSISEHAAEVLQVIVHQRYKLHRPIVMTSNRVVQDWGKSSTSNSTRSARAHATPSRGSLENVEMRISRPRPVSVPLSDGGKTKRA